MTSQEPSRPPPPTAPRPDALEQMHRISDTIVGPNLRPKDNLVQLIVCVVSAAIGAAAGALVARSYGESMGLGASLGAIGGLIVGVFGSGIVLMVMGWIRAAKRAG